MWWLLFLAVVVVVLSVIAYGPGFHRRAKGGTADGPSEQVLREADRGFGMISGWKNTGGFGDGGGGGNS